MEDNENNGDYNQDTWMSLLGLLHPSEYIVTTDHSNLWRKHLAWSKPDGKDLRNYTTQRFSSNMVFMSLILAAEINVLFNGSSITTDIRTQLIDGNYASLKHWIGFVILLSACVTVIALVSTFTAWGMVSSISDVNAHCLLRSSIGQLVTSLPSNYVVASLYLFLGWLVLFIIELTNGSVRIALLLMVMCLFFHTVVSLSAFGRLIIHTGAMGNRPVLEPTLEKALLPSGLHASLLIKATDRKRRKTTAMSMYRTPSKKTKSDNSSLSLSGGSHRGMSSSSNAGMANCSMRRQESQGSSPPFTDESQSTYRCQREKTSGISHQSPPCVSACSSSSSDTYPPTISSEEEAAIMETMQAMTSPEKENLRPGSGLDNSIQRYGSFLDVESREPFGSLASFPRPSILNKSVKGSDLKKVVEDALLNSSLSSLHMQAEDETPLRCNVGSRPVDQIRFGRHTRSASEDSCNSVGFSRRSLFGAKSTSRRSLLLGFRQASVRNSLQAEWNEEEDVRNMYDAPPAGVLFDADNEDQESAEENYGIDSNDVIMPHPSILNQTRRFRSLRRLASGNSLDSPSIGFTTEKSADPFAASPATRYPSNSTNYDVERGREEDDDGLVGESIHLLSSPKG